MTRYENHAQESEELRKLQQLRESHGHLVIIGGGEDRKHDKEILTRFVELSGGRDAKIVVITAASAITDEMWEIYDQAFGDLGVEQRMHLHLQSRQDANSPEHIKDVKDATGIFMTGGD